MIAHDDDILGKTLNCQESTPPTYSEGLNGSSTSTPSQNIPSAITSNDLREKMTTSSLSVGHCMLSPIN